MHKVGQADNFIHIVLICLQQYIFISLHFNYYFLCSILIILNAKKLTLVNPGLILELRFELVEQNHLLNDCLPFYCTFYKYESILLSYIKKKTVAKEGLRTSNLVPRAIRGNPWELRL